jgi:hypothetical protein
VEIAPTLPLRAVIAAEAAVAAGQVPRVAARLPVDGPEVLVAVATAATLRLPAVTAAEAAAEVAGRHPQAAVDGALLHLRAAVADAVHLPHRVAEATRAGGKIQFSFRGGGRFRSPFLPFQQTSGFAELRSAGSAPQFRSLRRSVLVGERFALPRESVS